MCSEVCDFASIGISALLLHQVSILEYSNNTLCSCSLHMEKTLSVCKRGEQVTH